MLRAVAQFDALTIARQLGLMQTIAQSAVIIPNTGNTTENTLVTIPIFADSMGPNGQIYVETDWLCDSVTANVKTARVKFGSTTFQSHPLTSLGSARILTIISNINSASAQTGMTTTYITYQGSSGISLVSGAVDTSVDTSITITAQLALATETLSLRRYAVKLAYGA